MEELSEGEKQILFISWTWTKYPRDFETDEILIPNIENYRKRGEL